MGYIEELGRKAVAAKSRIAAAPAGEKNKILEKIAEILRENKEAILSENEKEQALDILMRHYREEDFPYNKAVIPKTTVFKLTVEKCSGKRRMKK